MGRTRESPFALQKTAAEYWRAEALSPGHLSSVGWQFGLACESGATRLLNIGIGSGTLEYLLERSGRTVFSVDIDLSLSPSVVACLPYLPFVDAGVDAVLAFEVLEHLPFDLLSLCLAELARVARHSVIVSLPDRTPIPERKIDRLKRRLNPRTWCLYLQAQFDPRLRNLEVREPQLDPEHFWEIGVDGIDADGIAQSASLAGLSLIRHFRNHLFWYHHFFVFRKGTGDAEAS